MIDEPDLYRSDRGTVVVALGGNALIEKGQQGTVSEQEAKAARVAEQIFCLVEADYNIVITHGNGPQVGRLLLRNDLTREQVPPMPLDVLVAETQGELGYFLQQALLNRLIAENVRRYVVTVITQVIVDRGDPAFSKPAKPIGLYYDDARAQEMERALGWNMKRIGDDGWRRVVPSPEPIQVIQRNVIRHAASEGNIVIAGGGGGVPVRVTETGDLEGIEAVIDKDLTSSLIARGVEADLLVILMAEPNVCKGYGTKRQTALGDLSTKEARKLLAAGHFPEGSVGPKVTACVRFVEDTDKPAIITSPEMLEPALNGQAGTRFIPD